MPLGYVLYRAVTGKRHLVTIWMLKTRVRIKSIVRYWCDAEDIGRTITASIFRCWLHWRHGKYSWQPLSLTPSPPRNDHLQPQLCDHLQPYRPNMTNKYNDLAIITGMHIHRHPRTNSEWLYYRIKTKWPFQYNTLCSTINACTSNDSLIFQTSATPPGIDQSNWFPRNFLYC